LLGEGRGGRLLDRGGRGGFVYMCRLGFQYSTCLVLGVMVGGVLNFGIWCYTTGMFTLPDPMSHVSSATFAQARLSFGSRLLKNTNKRIYMFRVSR